ncbi:unnamed protein product [Urochloa decumbens]|uniref:Pectinesterase inhibitor domain-containing protein n=1 Tax=Urochloa decumbens TaxID=240449 RepID=A0ABC9BWZ8_9POAL
MATALLLAISSLAALFAAASADIDPWTCLKPGPTMTWSDACLKSCPTPALFNLCGETLMHAPDAAAANAYALAAAERAKASFDTTRARAGQMLVGGGWFPGPQREACRHRADYAQAVAAVERCGAALKEFYPGSPLVGMNADDRELAVLASALGGLIYGGQ